MLAGAPASCYLVGELTIGSSRAKRPCLTHPPRDSAASIRGAARHADSISVPATYRNVPILDSAKPDPVWSGDLERHWKVSGTFASVVSMAGDARERNGGRQPTNGDAALSARLKRLGEQLAHAQPGKRPEDGAAQRSRSDSSAMARGFRLSTELVAGVLVGAAIGWLIDRWLGISPWGMIVFLLLGFAAGGLNVMRAAGVNPADNVTPPDSKQ